MSRLETQKHALGLCIILGFASSPLAAAGQEPEKVESSLRFQAHMETIYVNFDQKSVAPWLKPIFEVLDHRFVKETKPRTIVVEVTLHTDRPAEVVVASRPALSDADTKAVLDTLDTAKSPHSLVVDGTFRIVTKVNGGTPDDSGPFSPPLVSRADRELASFNLQKTVAGKRALLRGWASTDAIPLLAAFALHRNRPEDEATRNFGKALQGVKGDGPIDVAALTDKNPDFWRAMIQSPRGDLLIATSAVALRAANGEIHYARRLDAALEVFASEDFGAIGLLRNFSPESPTLRRGFEPAHPERRRASRPGSFRRGTYDLRRHSQGRSEVTLGALRTVPDPTGQIGETTAQHRARLVRGAKAILEANPLYESMAEASSTDELYELLLRKEIETLFKKRENFPRNIIRYADIALDLGQPGFAAMVYWNALREIDPAEYANRNLSEDMLYCLEQLGVKDVKSNFPGDHAAQFKRIDAERVRRKQQTPQAIGPDQKASNGKP